nr:immunoglobulin heavy chain junction region [Macaca mulatta]
CARSDSFTIIVDW